MSVLIETSLGDIVIDLLVDYAPKLCENFVKLCKIKYYNFAPLHSIQKSFSFQTGDPLGPLSKESDGGSSIWGLLSGDPKDRTFPALFHPKLKHLERGTVGMATAPHPTDPDTRLAGSQFIVMLGDHTDYLDGKSAIFGRVVEGFDVLEKINDAIVDAAGNPLVDIRIRHTIVLDDPYPDPPGLREPSSSPPPTKAQLATVRIAEEDAARLAEDDGDEAKVEAAERRRREDEARAQALTLEIMGDLPFAEVAPPENVLFVCKLNPVTADADLELIFSRFGKVLSCEVVRDRKTGDSLQYAFVEFADRAGCEQAYFKMQGVLIDDRRIHVDFSQSVSKLSDAWRSEENKKRRNNANGKGKGRGKGGWGGVEELQKWRKYRDEDEDEDDDGERGGGREGRGRYGMVYGDEEMKGRYAKAGDREREQDPDRADNNTDTDDRRRDDRRDRGGGFRGGYGRGDRRDPPRRQEHDYNDEGRTRPRRRSRSPPGPGRDEYRGSGDRHGGGRRTWARDRDGGDRHGDDENRVPDRDRDRDRYRDRGGDRRDRDRGDARERDRRGWGERGLR